MPSKRKESHQLLQRALDLIRFRRLPIETHCTLIRWRRGYQRCRIALRILIKEHPIRHCFDLSSTDRLRELESRDTNTTQLPKPVRQP
jgi:hypothetical protein